MMETKQTELAKTDPAAVTPMAMIQRAFESAIANGAGLEVVDRILAQQHEMIAYQAKCEWNDALARCQAAMKHIARDAQSDKGRYASYAQLDKTLRPIYMQEGFSLSFNEEVQPNPDLVRVVCTVARGGHERIYTMDIPADGKGAKGGDVMTKTHAHGSAVTYGKRYLLNMIFNVAVGDKDDDGNSAAGLDIKTYAPLMEAIEGATSDKDVTAAYIRALKLAKTENEKAEFEKAAIARRKALR
jgi:hypothetical protein